MGTFGPYPATVVNVHDGDTITVALDLGFDITFRSACRVYGCNAAELSTDAGKAARDYVAALMPVGSAVTVVSHGWDKYGARFDGAITLPDGRNLTAVLVAEQWAAAWDGNGKAPVPPWPRTVDKIPNEGS